MKTNLKTFKIAENSKKFDIVSLEYNEETCRYIVSWKWTTMKEANEKEFVLFMDANDFYKERKQFAIECN